MADLMINYGWSKEYILWQLRFSEVLWWWDVLQDRLGERKLEDITDFKTPEQIRAEFKWNDKTGRYE